MQSLYLLTQFDVLTALHRENTRTRGHISPTFATAVFTAYAKAKLQKGRSPLEVSWKIADLEPQFPNLASSFIQTRRSLGLPEGMYRLAPMPSYLTSSSSSSSSSRPPQTQWEASNLNLNTASLGAGARRNTHSHPVGGYTTSSGGNFYSSARINPGRVASSGNVNTNAGGSTSTSGRRPTTSTPTTATTTTTTTTSSTTTPANPEEGEDLPPPPYTKDDPEPESTRQLEIRLAGEQIRGQVDLPEVVQAAGMDGTEVDPSSGDVDVGREGNDGGGGGGGTPMTTTSAGEDGLTAEQREERDLEEAIRLSLVAEQEGRRTEGETLGESSSSAGDAGSRGNSGNSSSRGNLPPIRITSPPPDFHSQPPTPVSASANADTTNSTSSTASLPTPHPYSMTPTTIITPSSRPPTPPPRPLAGPFAHRRAISEFPPSRGGYGEVLPDGEGVSMASSGGSENDGGVRFVGRREDLMDSTEEEMRMMSIPGGWNDARQGGDGNGNGNGNGMMLAPTPISTHRTSLSHSASPESSASSPIDVTPTTSSNQGTSTRISSRNPFANPFTDELNSSPHSTSPAPSLQRVNTNSNNPFLQPRNSGVGSVVSTPTIKTMPNPFLNPLPSPGMMSSPSIAESRPGSNSEEEGVQKEGTTYTSYSPLHSTPIGPAGKPSPYDYPLPISRNVTPIPNGNGNGIVGVGSQHTGHNPLPSQSESQLQPQLQSQRVPSSPSPSTSSRQHGQTPGTPDSPSRPLPQPPTSPTSVTGGSMSGKRISYLPPPGPPPRHPDSPNTYVGGR